ncbi:hypothetical protein AB5I41_04430 [Sphingomonas sp. MMS24-JH45]
MSSTADAAAACVAPFLGELDARVLQRRCRGEVGIGRRRRDVAIAKCLKIIAILLVGHVRPPCRGEAPCAAGAVPSRCSIGGGRRRRRPTTAA